MASEISISTRLYAKKSYLVIDHNPGTFAVTLSGSTSAGGIVSIPTTAGGTALSLDGITTATMGYAFFRNISATYSVQIGVRDASSNFLAFAKLQPGEVGLIRMNQTNPPYAIAITSPVDLQYTILAD